MRANKFAQLVTVAAIAIGTAGTSASIAAATTPEERITICHATASNSNPYVQITVNINSIIGESGHGNSGINEGDIIAPIPGQYAGNNWDAAHAAIFDNDCNIPAATPPGDGDYF